MSYLLCERRADVAIVTLNRPERRNALGSELLGALIEQFAALDVDPSAKAIVLTGAGKGFSAGADLKEFSGDDKEAVSRLNIRMAAFARSIGMMATPVISAVDGFALGAGLVLAASCDLVVTAPDARWHLPEVSLGWLPGFGLHALAGRVGIPKARRIAFGAAPLSGSEAFAIGLADAAGAPALETAVGEAEKLARLPPHAVASAKRYFSLLDPGGEPMDALANRVYAQDATHPDAQATMRRFHPR